MNHETRRRLVKREISVGQRQKEALSVARADREGVVDGVIVDFRHPDITPGEWEAREFWHVGADDNQHSGFIFPSEVIACEHPNNSHLYDLLADKKKLPRANAGDKLTVESVTELNSDRRFDHPHDAIVKEAYLALTRPNGEVVRPSSPLRFYGVTQLRDAPSRDVYDRIAARVLSDRNWPDYDELEEVRARRIITPHWPSEAEMSFSDRALLAIDESERAWHQLVDEYFRDDAHGRRLLRAVLSGAVRAAFFQAKHESNEAEERASTQLENLAEGSRTRKNWDWIAAGRKIASEHPDWARNRIVTGVIKELKLPETKRVSLLRSFKREQIGPDK